MDMLSSGSDATYSFQGMKRRLGLHQEKLTRILKRLEDDNLVLKTDEGYKVLRHTRKTTNRVDEGEPVIRGQLPPGMDHARLTSKLKGRWFKNFRWLGYSTNEAGQSLYWITEDGRFQLVVRFGPAEILVWSQPTNEVETRSAIAAGYELFDRISRILPEAEDNS
jgi:DNA-binding HxlR family transcriptional regulator